MRTYFTLRGGKNLEYKPNIYTAPFTLQLKEIEGK
jgi:hypothetical protein